MEWLTGIRAAIDYMEKNLLTIRHAGEAAQAAYISPFYLQKGFSVMTGFSISEYIRNRRLYLAALEVRGGREKVIDIALKYGYDTPESFTRAFARFHGCTPSQLREGRGDIRMFLPLKITIDIKGGDNMDFIVEHMPALRLIGFARVISGDTAYADIPAYWDELRRTRFEPLMRRGAPQTDVERAMVRCHVGQYGACVDHFGKDRFVYMAAGEYDGGDVPEGMQVFELPEMDWAKFRCTGPLPGALQAVNTRIFREWLPGNGAYELANDANIEWYAPGDPESAQYESAIWVPVRRI